jgi:hypothetical protein
MKGISRRNFLKISGLALGTLAFNPIFPYYEETGYGELARIAVKEIDLYAEPDDKSEIIGKRYRDQLVHVYEEVTSSKGPTTIHSGIAFGVGIYIALTFKK